MKKPEADVRAYSHEVVEELLRWCRESAEQEPLGVLVAGLSYALGLNEHQCAAALVSSWEPPLITYPLARRAGEFADAEWIEGDLRDPPWLLAAARAVLRDRTGSRDRRLIRPSRGAAIVPVSPGFVRSALAEATRRGLGVALTSTGLNASRIAEATELGHLFVPHSMGYRPGYAGRLTTGRRTARFVRREPRKGSS